MPSQFDQMLLAQLTAAQKAYLALLSDGGAVEKQAFGRSWKKSDASELYEQIIQLEKRCEQRGLLQLNLASSKKSVTQLMVFQPGQIIR